MKANFDACMAEVFRHEGGYVDHPKDPGGATNMGITHKTLAAWRGKPVTKADVKALTKAEAAAIYAARYWKAVCGDDLPRGLDLVAFDAAVNAGPARGARFLQSGLGVTPDGKIGPQTLAAARAAYAPAAIQRAIAFRLAFHRSLKTWPTFGAGWTKRIAAVEKVALAMASRAETPQTRTPPVQADPHPEIEPKPQPVAARGIAAALTAAAVALTAAVANWWDGIETFFRNLFGG